MKRLRQIRRSCSMRDGVVVSLGVGDGVSSGAGSAHGVGKDVVVGGVTVTLVLKALVFVVGVGACGNVDDG